MAAKRAKSLRRMGSLARSKSEGTLIDLDDDGPLNNNLSGSNIAWQERNHSDWPILQPEVQHMSQTRNPFWNGLSDSNPFLDDIVRTEANSNISNTNVSILKEDPLAVFCDNNADAISMSSDEAGFGQLLNSKQKSMRRSGRWKSTSDILEVFEKDPKKENGLSSSSQFLNPDFEWLKNDKEAYKMAWLSHRQLTRSCLDLGLMSQSPGWAQTQATETQISCKIGQSGGSLQLPDSSISAHIPEGHVLPGEVQEITMKTILDPPLGLNSDILTTVSPLLEMSLSNLNTKECILLEMKIAGEIKKDPLSQVMTKFVCLVSHKREGPFQKLKNCYIYKNMLQIKLDDLKSRLYIIAAAQASILQPPATSVWDYMDRLITLGVYGPKHIHPSFKAICVLFCHNEIPLKLPFSDMKRGNKNLPPLVLQLWGKHEFNPKGLKDLKVVLTSVDTKFEIKAADQIKEISQDHLKTGQVLRLPFELSKADSGEMVAFKLGVNVKDSDGCQLAHFHVLTPEATPRRSEKLGPKRVDKRREASRSTPIPEETAPQFPKFEDRSVNVQWYGVALKAVFRQPRVEYLLEYFKGDTVALLSRDIVRSLGQSKVKEWYIGFLRGRVGLVHCKNVKVITRDQVIDFSEVKITTQALLDNITLPFKKLTYMYSGIQTMITEQISSWRGFAEALGYSNLLLEEITWKHAETEAEKVACVLEKLKEDCHSEKSRKKFQHELIIGLLKMDCQGLVARITQSTVILSAAVELGFRWRELAERLGKLSCTQIAAYEAPHLSKNGEVSPQSMWKPAYDFLYTWSLRYGEGYQDMIQDLHLALDKMKTPVTRHWRQITGALITVNCMEILHVSAFPKQ
ncbi:metastasis-associated in colon cancer protein 1 isoform X1 [Anguilla anguilla]|uniref:metastasis-associated in colon cancer protein 1 isoform X1 n=1 Tax=Anguilla anguilla TaxID=7936 RepID=UPI0015AB185B|nr:metastasis-associated in colon cancer protein 1 isoform X1 [Anguilla anguilla]XP_035250694.1 metastasis-associated in colon cancer protein 1 isoform X1 [Anguilla anguilla]